MNSSQLLRRIELISTKPHLHQPQRTVDEIKIPNKKLPLQIQPQIRFTIGNSAAKSITHLPNGTLLTISEKGEIFVWGRDLNKLAYWIDAGKNTITALSDNVIATGNGDGQINIWQMDFFKMTTNLAHTLSTNIKGKMQLLTISENTLAAIQDVRSSEMIYLHKTEIDLNNLNNRWYDILPNSNSDMPVILPDGYFYFFQDAGFNIPTTISAPKFKFQDSLINTNMKDPARLYLTGITCGLLGNLFAASYSSCKYDKPLTELVIYKIEQRPDANEIRELLSHYLCSAIAKIIQQYDLILLPNFYFLNPTLPVTVPDVQFHCHTETNRFSILYESDSPPNTMHFFSDNLQYRFAKWLKKLNTDLPLHTAKFKEIKEEKVEKLLDSFHKEIQQTSIKDIAKLHEKAAHLIDAIQQSAANTTAEKHNVSPLTRMISGIRQFKPDQIAVLPSPAQCR